MLLVPLKSAQKNQPALPTEKEGRIRRYKLELLNFLLSVLVENIKIFNSK